MLKNYWKLFVATIFLSSPLSAQEVAVTIGSDGAEWDACGSVGRVHNLDPNGDNYLSVRTGPSSDFEAIDRLLSGQIVYVCEQKGRWIGIVYAPYNYPELSCGVSSSTRQPQNYSGACRSGWVFDSYVQMIAG